jgi:hypothetical protein
MPENRGSGSSLPRPRVLNLLFALGILYAGLVWFNVQYSRDTLAIVQTIDGIAPRSGIAMIGGDMSIGFPITPLVHGSWARRSVSRWMAASAHCAAADRPNRAG